MEEKKEPCEDECCGGHNKEPDMPTMMMYMAQDAWAELMKEKMKAAFDAKRGDKMEAAAQLAVDHSITCWNAKMQGKEVEPEKHQEYGKKLMEIFQS